MARVNKILWGLLLFAVLTAPLVMVAQTQPGPLVGSKQPCAIPNDCQFQDFINLVGRIFNWVIYLAVPIATIAIGYAGFLYLTSSTNEGNRSKAKGIITNTVIGLVVTLAAYVIVKSLLTLIGANSAFTSFIK